MTPTATPAPVYFDLGRTATYRRRRAGWFAGPKGPQGGHADGRLGTLRIVLEKAKRAGDSTEVDEYGLYEDTGVARPPGVRSFLLAKDDPTEPDRYRCVVGADERSGLVYDACTCRAGEHGKRCKHLDSLETLIAKAVL